MVREWIEPIYNRNYGDIQSAQLNPNQENPIGCYNTTDLNRIEKNTAYCIEYMLEHKIYRSDPMLNIRENDYWQADMIPTDAEMRRIINNVAEIVEYTREKQVPEIAKQLPHIIASTQMTFNLANDIEQALDILHNQPNLPLDYFKLTIENGIIKTILRASGETETIMANEAMIAEDEVATILGVEYGEYAQYQIFQYWNAETDPLDIDALDDYRAKETTYLGQYRDVKFKANFMTRIPRQLTLSNGYISINADDKAESGPNTGTYFAGDEIMIIANRATSGKAFYEWLGTEEGVKNITGASETDPSTCWLIMPDCDVSLSPHYINAGQHSVSVAYGSGGGWYDYNEYVSIGADNRGNKWEFSNWSGDTGYLSDIYSSYQSFRMGDLNINFRANYRYVYSYNDIQIIDGLININGENVSQAEGVMETSEKTLVPTPPDSTQGLDYWSVEGEGYVITDYLGNHTNTFRVGDGNAIITGHYNILRNVTVENLNNGGGVNTYQVVKGHKRRYETNEIVGNYIFENWTINGNVVSTSTRYDITIPDNDITLRANYRLRNSVQVYINYGNHSETVTMLERESRNITADTNPSGTKFLRWDYSNLYTVYNGYSSSTSFVAGNSDGSITAIYENYHELTVNYGSGSGTIIEGNSVTINGNQAPDTYEFDYWEIDSGNGTIDNVYSRQTTFRMRTEDTVITAHYKPIPYFNVVVENGYINVNNEWVTSASILRDSQPTIQMKPAPEGKQFLQWEVLRGENNDVSQPLAETTTLRNVTHDITVRATYYIPDPETKYTLVINRNDGSVTQSEHPAGERVDIYCSTPVTGMRFYRWSGDYQYLTVGQPAPRYYGGTHDSPQIVNMPAKNISLTEDPYVPLDYETKFHLYMTNNAQCLYQTTSTDSETGEETVTDHWVDNWEYPEGTIVQIRVINILDSKHFTEWQAVNDSDVDMRSIITKLDETPTTLVMPDDDVYVTPLTPDKDKYRMVVLDGGDNIEQYEGGRVNIWFGKTNTDDVHYEFNRWTGEHIADLKLYDTGRQFNVRVPGTEALPQSVAMLPYTMTLVPSYNTFYHLTITNGVIDNVPERGPYFIAGEEVSITANPAPEGMKFQRWEGHTSGVANIYDPTTTVTTVQGITNLTAKYSLDSEQNNIGFVLTDLSNSNIINNEDINIIFGELNTGFIITDNNGHIYIVTNAGESTSSILRLTKILKGGDVYE